MDNPSAKHIINRIETECQEIEDKPSILVYKRTKKKLAI